MAKKAPTPKPAPVAPPAATPALLKTPLRKASPGMPPTLVFRKDFRQAVRGDLRPGVALTVYYDAERLPPEKASAVDEQGRPHWTAYAYLRFGPAAPIVKVPLWSPTGIVLSKAGNDTGEGTMLRAEVEVPADAREVEVWFSLDMPEGWTFYDSQHGTNYHFRFSHAVLVTYAAVVVPAAAPNDDLEVSIETDVDVDSVTIDYIVTNTVPDPPLRASAELKPVSVPNDLADSSRRPWAVKGVCVPQKAVVYFTIRYTAGGHDFVDDNNRQGYLVS